MEIKRALETLHYCMLFTSKKRAAYVRKHKIFGSVGNDVFLPLWILPFRGEHIYLHNNIEIASGAKLIPHDAIHGVLNRMDGTQSFEEQIGKIEIMDNVFIGANAIILGPVTIGPNSIVAAGALVNHDVAPGTVVGGVPAKQIGTFEELKNKRKGMK